MSERMRLGTAGLLFSNNNNYVFTFSYLFYLCVWMPWGMWRSEDSLWRSLLSLVYYMIPGDPTQLVWLGGKHLTCWVILPAHLLLYELFHLGQADCSHFLMCEMETVRVTGQAVEIKDYAAKSLVCSRYKVSMVTSRLPQSQEETLSQNRGIWKEG